MPKFSLVPLHQLQPGPPADCFALLFEKQKKSTRDGKPFFDLQFRDIRRAVSCAIWADNPLFQHAEGWAVGGFYKLRVTYAESEKYGPKIELIQLREVVDKDREDGFKEADFYERSRFDSEEMLKEIREIVEAELKDEPLKKLTLGLLDDNAASLKVLPASDRRFFPFPGGWLEHIRNVLKNCLYLIDRYRELYPDFTPPLNRDLLLAGAVLHDIGRVKEFLIPDVPGQPIEHTVEGRMFGYIGLGRDMVRDAAAKIEGLNPELLQLLEHIVLSHLTLPEWGSPRLPVIPEVLILHHADDLDAKLEMYYRCLTRDTSPGPFTDPDPLLKKPLLKRRSV